MEKAKRMMAMCRISIDGITWKEIWIREGTFNIEEKRYAKHGFYMKPSIVRKEM